MKLLTTACLAAVLALAATMRRPAPGRRVFAAAISMWLLLVAGALVIVGLVSNTLIRHLVQIGPLVLAMFVSWRRPDAGVAAAAPLFGFWLLVCVAIWLFLFSLTRIFTGTFPPAEIALTIVIGAASAAGLVAAHRQGTALMLARRVTTIVAVALLQFAAMWLSTLPFAAPR